MKNLYVGAAKVNIDLTEELQPYPSFNRVPFEGVYSECNMRVIVVDNGKTQAAVLGYDLGGIPSDPELKHKIEAKFGITAEHIFLTATHNHTGCDIVMSPDREDRKKAAGYQKLLEERTMEALEKARKNMRCARYGYGEGKSYINGNRDMATSMGTFTQGYEPEGYCDRTVSVMKFVDENDDLIAAVVNYGMHATLGFLDVDVDGKTKSSGNIPGIAEEYVEARYGNDSVVLWTSAAAGDQNPELYCLRDYGEDGFPYMARLVPGLQYNMIRIMGKRHGVDICNTIDRIDTYSSRMPLKFGQKMIELPAQKFEAPFDHQRINDLTNHIYKPEPGEELPVAVPDEEHTVPLYIQELIFGDIAFVGVAAEIYALIGKACKEISPYRKTMVITHIGPNAGYVIDRTSVSHQCFEQFGPIRAGGCDEVIAEGVRSLFDDMLEDT
ncbi:MAG: hypothetical protein K2O40_02385 [Lachnospiraceae bacterium]|nr:hypothetical protein [Lachnospiraceae bacterium]